MGNALRIRPSGPEEPIESAFIPSQAMLLGTPGAAERAMAAIWGMPERHDTGDLDPYILLAAPSAWSRTTVAELEAELDDLRTSISEQELHAIDGYLASVRREGGVWIGHCPTMRCVCEADTRDEAVVAMRESIEDMASVLEGLGEELPPKDTTHGS